MACCRRHRHPTLAGVAVVALVAVAVAGVGANVPGLPALEDPDDETWKRKPHVFILSTGGTGCTSLFNLLSYRRIPTNDRSDNDGLKHGTFPRLLARMRKQVCCRPDNQQCRSAHGSDSRHALDTCPAVKRTGTPQAELALGVYVFDDPIRSIISLFRRGWGMQQMKKTRSDPWTTALWDKALKGIDDYPSKCNGQEKKIFIRSQKRKFGNLLDSETPIVPDPACRQAVDVQGGKILRNLAALGPDADAFQLEKHLDSFVRGACAGQLGAPLLFLRSSTRWRHMAPFAELIGDDVSTFPESVTAEYVRHTKNASMVPKALLQHFQPLMKKMKWLGEFQLINATADGQQVPAVCRHWGFKPTLLDASNNKGSSGGANLPPNTKRKNGGGGGKRLGDAAGLPNKPAGGKAIVPPVKGRGPALVMDDEYDQHLPRLAYHERSVWGSDLTFILLVFAFGAAAVLVLRNRSLLRLCTG